MYLSTGWLMPGTSYTVDRSPVLEPGSMDRLLLREIRIPLKFYHASDRLNA